MLHVYRRFQALAVFALLSVVVGLLPRVCWAQAGTLDASFGTDGKVVTSFSPLDDWAWSMAIQPDGKIVAAGRVDVGGNVDVALARYNADGTLDHTFGTGGMVTTEFGGSLDAAFSVAIQADGRIVAAGRSNAIGNDDFALARYNADGSLDTSFDGDGKVTTDMDGMHNWARSLAIQADGKIVAAGRVDFPGNVDIALARYNADGTLDDTFGTGGMITTSFHGSLDAALSLAIQADGKIVVAGRSNAFGTDDFALARYNADGRLDASFDGDGRVVTDFAGSIDWAYSVAIQADGKIVAAGRGRAGGNTDYALARYDADGSLDTSFDGDGKVTIDFDGKLDEAYSVAIQADGKIVAGGSALFGGTLSDVALVRYNADGTRDDTFGTDGIVTIDFYCLGDYAGRLAIQGNGRIVAAGAATVSGRGYDFALVRYIGVPPQEEIAFIMQDVEGLVASGSLNDGQGHSLLVKLQGAIDKLDRGNERAAVNQLAAFSNEVDAFIRAGVLTPEEGHPLIAAAQATAGAITQAQ